MYGDSHQYYLVAVVVPDEEEALRWAASQESLKGCDAAAVVASDAFRKAVTAEMQELARLNRLAGFEVPMRLHFSREQFTVENDCLTPTFKLKRAEIKKKYMAHIEALYAKGKL